MDNWFISLVDKFDGYGIALYVLLTCVIAGILSSIIGLEREFKGQSAGLRTHVLVSIACSLLMSLSIYAIRKAVQNTDFASLTYDASRIGAGILSGVGFIGAGTIIKSGLNIRGLTTAATLWLTAALGMACGCGFIFEAIIVAIVSMFFLISLTYVEKFFEKRSPTFMIEIRKESDYEDVIKNEASNFEMHIKNFVVLQETKHEDGSYVQVMLKLSFRPDKVMLRHFEERLHSLSGVVSVDRVH
jgi:putative Mg2+ transporter-C (MgtC) family protein